MSFPFPLSKQIEKLEQKFKIFSTQVETMYQNVNKELQQQRTILQQLSEQVQRQRADFTRDLQQLQSSPVPTGSKNLSELHSMHIQKTRMTSEAISDLETIYQEFDQAYKAADQERIAEQEHLASAMDKLFGSTRTTDEMEALRDEEEKEENPPETA